MSATHRIGLLLLVGLAFVLGNTFAGAQKAEPAKAEFQKWEHNESSGLYDAKAQAGHGEAGWELVAITVNPQTGFKTFYFKRPKQ